MSDDYDFIVEAQLTPDDWGDYSAAEKEARTFDTTADTTDTRMKILEMRLVRNYYGKLRDLTTWKPGKDGNFFIFPNKDLDGTAASTHNQVLSFNTADGVTGDFVAKVENYMGTHSTEEKIIEMTVHYMEADSYKIFFKCNELIKIICVPLGIDAVFKILQIDHEFGENWIVKVVCTDNPSQIEDALPPDIIDKFANELFGKHGIDSPEQGVTFGTGYHPGVFLTVGQRNQQSGNTRSINKLMTSNHWEENPEDDNKYITTILAKDYDTQWDTGYTPYIAVGDDDSNPTALAMENELARVSATYTQYSDAGGDTVAIFSATFTNDDFTGTSYPYMMKEVALITTDSGGTPLSRTVYWQPATAENLADDQPSGTTYYPFKPMFKNSKIYAQYNLDEA